MVPYIIVTSLLLLFLGAGPLPSIGIEKLEEPDVELTPCTKNDKVIGLSESDFIKLQMYISGLRHTVNEWTLNH